MSFAEQPDRMQQARVPLAPMMDILFLLLVFFVTTSSFRAEESAIDVGLPTAETGQDLKTISTEVVVNITNDGRIIIANRTMDLPQMRTLLSDLIETWPNERVIIRGDKKVTYEQLIEVVDAARAVGVNNIHFATVKKAGEIIQPNN